MDGLAPPPTRRPRPDDERLVEECEAFLAGQWANVRDALGQPVPLVAWLNLLAHGSMEDVAAVSHLSPFLNVGAMSKEVLRVARDEDLLRELQWTSLVPLELELLATGGDTSVSMSQLFSLVVEAVDAFGRGSLEAGA
jgi:hypothetical protein